MVIGNTNAGKSTFLSNITGMKGFFNTNVTRETTCFWRFRTQVDLETKFRLSITVTDTKTDKVVSMTQTGFDQESDLVAEIRRWKAEVLEDNSGDESDEDDSLDEEGFPPEVTEVEVVVKESVADERGFKVISERLHVVDIPGIEDAKYAKIIVRYLQKRHR